MSERLRSLVELERELQRAWTSAPEERRAASRPARRVVLLVLALLLATGAVAAATVLLIREGSPLPGPHAQDRAAEGIPVAGSARLAGLDAPDPGSGVPPWDLRLSRTRRGEVCVAVGQVVRGRFGIVGLDGVFRPIPLGGVDACSVAAPGVPVLAGARSFLGRTPADERTVVSGVAGRAARAVTVIAAGGSRTLRLGPEGSFITVYAGMPEAIQPRIDVTLADGRRRVLEIDPSAAGEVKDPGGGAPWRVSTEADLQRGAYADESCAQVSQQPDQEHPNPGMEPLTPELCGRLGSSPLFVVMRRFVPGSGAGSPYPWGNSPARTLVYGVADPRVASLSLSGAGITQSIPIERRGGAFVAVLDGHVEPASLALTARLSGGGTVTLRHSSALFDSNTNRPVAEAPVPPYSEPRPQQADALPPFELEIPSTAREALHATDPVDGRTWVLRSWLGAPNTSVKGVRAGEGEFQCVALGVRVHGRLVAPSATPSVSSPSVTAEEGRCDHPRELKRMRYMLQMESFVADPYAYAPRPGRVVLSGLLPSGAREAVIYGLGKPRPLTLDANDAFLLVLPGRFWHASPHISYVLGGRHIGRGPGTSFPFGDYPRRPGSRAPDPDGSAAWGFAATRDCHTAVGRVVEGALASLDEQSGVLKTGPSETGWSAACITHFRGRLPGPVANEPVQFNVNPTETYSSLPGRTRSGPTQPEIERRTLPGRTLITGVALPSVASVTITTPTDVRTLRPSGPLHTLLAVYAGSFLGGPLTAEVTLRDGRTVDQQLFGPGAPPAVVQTGPVPAQRLASIRTQLRETDTAERRYLREGDRRRARSLASFRATMLAFAAVAERRLAYERAHPGLLPPG